MMLIDWPNVKIEIIDIQKHFCEKGCWSNLEWEKRVTSNQFVFICNGRGKVKTHLGWISIKKNRCFWLKPGFDYEFTPYASRPFELYRVQFELYDIQKNIPVPLTILPPDVITHPDAMFLLKLLERFYFTMSAVNDQRVLAQNRNIHEEKSENILRLILMEADEASSENSSNEVVDFEYDTNKDYIANVAYRFRHDPHYRPLISKVAEGLGMSENSFSKTFKRRFKMTPLKYSIFYRIIYASRLLVETTLTVKEIAYSLGYDDPQFFGKQFRQIMKQSPKKYRLEKIKKKLETI